MSWKELIAGCFGTNDNLLAIHWKDHERTINLINKALSEGAVFSDIINEIEAYLVDEGCSIEHIEEQKSMFLRVFLDVLSMKVRV